MTGQPEAIPPSGFDRYMERRQRGLIGRFLETFWRFVALVLGGAFAYVRHKQALGEHRTFLMLVLRFLLIFVWPFLDKRIISLPFPVQFRIRLEQLGPTYIKLGQILSLREDLLPRPITDELKNLLDHLPAVSYERLKQLIVDDLRRPLNTMFLWIDPIPLGSASLGQTHRARLVSREKVVIKVLKPGVRRMVETDTILLRFFGRFLQIFLGRYQPERLISEFCSYTLREVDLRFEADNADTFTANFKNEPNVRFPHIYREYSSRDILTMEYFKGVRPDAALSEKMSEVDRERIIELGVKAIAEMIFRDGFFHADLHPANIIIFPDGKVGFIDLGMVGQFDRDMRRRMFYYFYSLVNGDASSAARYLSSMAIPTQGTDIEGFRRAVTNLYSRWLRNPGFRQFSLAQVILQSVLMAGQYRVNYPAEIILMVKALVTVEGLGNLIAPGINITHAAQKPIRSILIDQFNPLDFARDMVLVLPEMIDILRTTPLILSDSLKAAETNLKQPPRRDIASLRSSVLAGFCLLTASLMLAFGEPWPIWTILYLLAVFFALRG